MKMKFDDTTMGASILEIITSGLYSNNLNCLREYIQNAIDGKAKSVRISYCNGGCDLELVDDGDGMDQEKFINALKVGSSHKSKGDVGWRGIGIWSGCAVCKSICIVTKSKSNQKLMVNIECSYLTDSEYQKGKTANDVLSKCLESGIVELSASDDEEGKSYTKITLIGIYKSLLGAFSPVNVKEYLSRTIPLRFSESFKPGKLIVEKLKEYGVCESNISLFVNDEEVMKQTISQGDVFTTPCFVELRSKLNKGLLAVAYFLTTNKNGYLPNSSMTFRKDNFRIGETSLVTQNINKRIKLWQHVEIHVLDNNIKENAARDGFNTSVSETNEMFEEVGKFLDNLESLTHYTSDMLATTSIKKIEELKRNGQNSEYLDKLESARRKGNSKRTIDASLNSAKECIDRKAMEESAILRALENNYRKEVGLEDDSSTDLKNLKEMATSKTAVNTISKSFDPLVKSQYDKRTKEGKLVPNLSICDPLLELMKELTGETLDSVTKYSNMMFDWNHVSHVDQDKKESSVTYDPAFSIVGDIGDGKSNTRNKQFGVFLSFIWEYYRNSDEHMLLERMPWYRSMSQKEKEEWNNMGWILVDVAVKMLRHAEKRDPLKKK